MVLIAERIADSRALEERLGKVTKTVVGFDRNPVTVLILFVPVFVVFIDQAAAGADRAADRRAHVKSIFI
jgi:hypothetical protein